MWEVGEGEAEHVCAEELLGHDVVEHGRDLLVVGTETETHDAAEARGVEHAADLFGDLCERLPVYLKWAQSERVADEETLDDTSAESDLDIEAELARSGGAATAVGGLLEAADALAHGRGQPQVRRAGVKDHPEILGRGADANAAHILCVTVVVQR